MSVVWHTTKSALRGAALSEQWFGVQPLPSCDPYLVWKELTSQSSIERAAVILELARSDFRSRILQDLATSAKTRPPLFVSNDKFEGGTGSRFVTGVASQEGLESLMALLRQGLIRRFTMQAVRPDVTASVLTNSQRTDKNGVRGTTKGSLLNSPYDCDPAAPFIGVIDDGVPLWYWQHGVALPLDLWDQGWLSPSRRGSTDGLPMEPPTSEELRRSNWSLPWDFPVGIGFPKGRTAGFLYGRRFFGPVTTESSSDPYALGDYMWPQPRTTHGASVLGLVMGAGRTPTPCSGIAAVSFPSAMTDDTSGGALTMHAIDALRYVLWREQASRAQESRPRQTVINMSYGVFGGPHDGTSLFEAAAAEFLDSNPHVHLVLPAGNSHLAACHASGWLQPAGLTADTRELSVRLLPDNGRQTLIEVWFGDGPLPSLEISPPGSSVTHEVTAGEVRYLTRDGQIEFGCIYPRSVAQADQARMALIAIAPTAVRTQRLGSNSNDKPMRAPHGIWKVKVRNKAAVPIFFDLWIERGDAAPDRTRGMRQAFLPDSSLELPARGNAQAEGTLSGLACFAHRQLTVVGAMRKSDGSISDYSAAGPARGKETRVDGPDVVVAADRSASQPGIRATGLAESSVVYLSGTSAASGLYAGHLARALANGPESRPIGVAPPEAAPVVDSSPEEPPRAPDHLRGQFRRIVLDDDKVRSPG